LQNTLLWGTKPPITIERRCFENFEWFRFVNLLQDYIYSSLVKIVRAIFEHFYFSHFCGVLGGKRPQKIKNSKKWKKTLGDSADYYLHTKFHDFMKLHTSPPYTYTQTDITLKITFFASGGTKTGTFTKNSNSTICTKTTILSPSYRGRK
jgi:hypothetical protein